MRETQTAGVAEDAEIEAAFKGLQEMASLADARRFEAISNLLREIPDVEFHQHST